MLEQASVLIFIVIALALIFDFVNGFHDTANAIATCVSTRAVPPAVAIIMSAVLNFAGAMISTGVAKTIGGDIVQSASMVNEVIFNIIGTRCESVCIDAARHRCQNSNSE